MGERSGGPRGLPAHVRLRVGQNRAPAALHRLLRQFLAQVPHGRLAGHHDAAHLADLRQLGVEGRLQHHVLAVVVLRHGEEGGPQTQAARAAEVLLSGGEDKGVRDGRGRVEKRGKIGDITIAFVIYIAC